MMWESLVLCILTMICIYKLQFNAFFFRGNKLGPDGGSALAPALARLSCLALLDLRCVMQWILNLHLQKKMI